MSLPKGMRWVDLMDQVSGDTHSFIECEGETMGYEFVQLSDSSRFYLSRTIVAKDGMINQRVGQAQAELIIRAIEAPHTLAVRDEL